MTFGRTAAALFVVLVVSFAALIVFRHPNAPAATTKTSAQPLPPEMTQEERAIVASSTGATALISYTDAGFEPATTTVHVGDTVRFFNSSSGELWVAATRTGGAIYTGQGNCGRSIFDMCHAISGGHFWEFTFTHAGTWSYQNNADTAKRGVVVVQ